MDRKRNNRSSSYLLKPSCSFSPRVGDESFIYDVEFISFFVVVAVVVVVDSAGFPWVNEIKY